MFPQKTFYLQNFSSVNKPYQLLVFRFVSRVFQFVFYEHRMQKPSNLLYQITLNL